MLLRLENLVLIWDMRATLWRYWDRRIPPWLVDLAFTKQMDLCTDGFSCEEICTLLTYPFSLIQVFDRFVHCSLVYPLSSECFKNLTLAKEC